jgi:hypothetical protein
VPTPFRGTINVDVRESVPDWAPYVQPMAPEGSPNVLYAVLDDVGHSAMAPLGGLIETPNIDRIAQRGLTCTNSILAGGNSSGDIPMLRYAGGASRPALRLLVLHDDDEREFAYTGDAEEALERAAKEHWTVASVKDDWTTVFAETRNGAQHVASQRR